MVQDPGREDNRDSETERVALELIQEAVKVEPALRLQSNLLFTTRVYYGFPLLRIAAPLNLAILLQNVHISLHKVFVYRGVKPEAILQLLNDL